MTELRKARMEELCELVTDGTHDSPKLQREGVPFIKGKNISGGAIDFSTCGFITLEDHKEACRRVKPQRGDILFSNVGSVGDTAVVNDDREFSIKNVALFRPDQNKVDRRYFYYLILSPEFCSSVMNIRSGSAQPFISLANLRSFEVRYIEDGGTQQRIAGILSAYDELIENSQQRIKILESMARALYREWFVYFRYPGHESVPLVPSALGDIPQGWEVKQLGDLVEIDKGVSYNGAGLTEHGNPLINLKNVLPGGGFRRDATKPYSGDFKPRHTVEPGDIVIANTDLTQAGNVVASAALVPRLTTDRPILISHHLFAVRLPAGFSTEYVYHLLLGEQFRGFSKGYAVGTTVLGLPKEGVLCFTFACPTEDLMKEFSKHVEPLHEFMETISEQIEILRATRDALLPRLLSGQINVEVITS